MILADGWQLSLSKTNLTIHIGTSDNIARSQCHAGKSWTMICIQRNTSWSILNIAYKK